MPLFDKSISLKSGASLAVLSLLLSGAAAHGLPSDGHFVSGQGQIGKAGQSLTVKQTSTTGIVNWSSFSVGKKNNVSFDNGTGATLNRVTGGNLSTIAGSLHATGTLYLMNSSGVIVSGSGRVVTGGSFVATSGNIVNSAFGTEDEKHRTANAAVVNHGTITTGGRAALFGGTVTNTGSITGRLVALRGDDGVNADGTLRATGNASRNGRIAVVAKSGETKIAGDLIARNADGSGGHIETSGRRVAIGGAIDAGKGGTWLVDPVNLTVDSTAANTIDDALDGGTDVVLQTTATGASGAGNQSSGPGDIIINSALSWNTTATLTLDAYHSVNIASSIGVTGQGNLTLRANDGGHRGNISFDRGDAIFANLNSALQINGVRYTLVDNLATLAQDVQETHKGRYALAASYDASADGTYLHSPIGNFDGTFQGLGNTIDNLTISAGNAKHQFRFGLFKKIEKRGLVANLGIVNINISGRGQNAGALAGRNNGVLRNDFSTGIVTCNGRCGGLVGLNTGSIADSYSTVALPNTFFALAGGLVGVNNGGKIIWSYATGDVSGWEFAGGLVGTSDGLIKDDFATGDVTGRSFGGGLVGVNVFANGKRGDITASYATGTVSDITSDSLSQLGGLVGGNDGGNINDAYATGAVSSVRPQAQLGGLIGNDNSLRGGSISQSYATGAVSGATIGGLVGWLDGSPFSFSYWDTDTAGTSAAIGNEKGVSGITGLTTAQFQSGLPMGFGSSEWTEDPSINGGLPYLIALASSY